MLSILSTVELLMLWCMYSVFVKHQVVITVPACQVFDLLSVQFVVIIFADEPHHCGVISKFSDQGLLGSDCRDMC